MSEPRPTLGPEYFDALYTADPDPWKFAASPYEQAKYTLTLNAMPKPRYRSALEKAGRSPSAARRMPTPAARWAGRVRAESLEGEFADRMGADALHRRWKSGFRHFSQLRLVPLRYRLPARFDTIPSRPSLQAWANTIAPSVARASLNTTPSTP
jgi:hypothetical protein